MVYSPLSALRLKYARKHRRGCVQQYDQFRGRRVQNSEEFAAQNFDARQIRQDHQLGLSSRLLFK
jgi:hypothetical protein